MKVTFGRHAFKSGLGEEAALFGSHPKCAGE